jgi:hypothetical protein
MTDKLQHKTLQQKKRAFLMAFAEMGNITRAAELAGIARSNHYDWLKDDPDYPALFREADQQACDRLEQEARRRAIEGLKRYKFGKNGQPLINPETGEPYYEHEYSDTLLIFLLKGANPVKYADRAKHEHTGKDGKPIESNITLTSRLEGLPEDQKEALRKELIAALKEEIIPDDDEITGGEVTD